MRGVLHAVLGAGVILIATCGVAAAQAVTERQSPDPTLLARGWAALAKGDLANAGKLANDAQQAAPGSAAALALAVEVELRRGGVRGALAGYEKWLGNRKVDEAYVLRRIAEALLRDAARPENAGVRLEALKALAADGDATAVQLLADQAAQGSAAEARLLASLGDERGVRALIAQLQSYPSGKAPIVNALVDSRSQLAVPALVQLLGDMREEHRVLGAEALGRLGAREAVNRLKPLLQDPSFAVRVAAAGALYRLEDSSGMPLLYKVLNSEHATVRLAAAEAMANGQDQTWLGAARELVRDPDPAVRLGAARLLAPYEREVAAATLAQLQQDGNLAIREEAGRIVARHIAGDFATLRGLLRSADPMTAVRAADRILELTR